MATPWMTATARPLLRHRQWRLGADRGLVEQTAPFTAIFEGNGDVIRNLAIRRNQPNYRPLRFHRAATIRNLGLEQALARYRSNLSPYIAPLVG